MRRAIGLVVPLSVGLLLGVAMPPALLPGAEFLVLPALMAWFALAADPKRSLWHSYLLGAAHMAWFSWSVHYYLWFSYAAVVVLGGCYYLLPAVAMRALPRMQPLAFPIAVAGSFWLRAEMPQIYYPHGQPCHALWQWPALLRGVVVGGEAGVNAMLAWIAAAAVQAWRSWRVAAPAWPPARRTLVAAAGTFVGITWLGWGLGRAGPSDETPVAVAAVEPAFHPHKEAVAAPRGRWLERLQQLVQERLVVPTRELLAAPNPPEVVLWPESSVRERLPLLRERIAGGGLRAPLASRADGRLVLGVDIAVHDGELPTPAAVMFDLKSGRSIDHHEKRVLVPGGEFPPLYAWLPRGLGDTLRGWAEGAFDFYLPESLPGADRPPLRGPRDVPFGVLICYDNAYAAPAAQQVAQGARWLAVLSNESWFEGGGELTQLVAMTVLRALETATPIVRCTMDGWSGAVDANGRVVASLPPPHGPAPAARILRVDVTPGPGRVPPLAWLRRWLGPALGAATLALLLHRVLAWARLRAARTAPRAEPADRHVGG